MPRAVVRVGAAACWSRHWLFFQYLRPWHPWFCLPGSSQTAANEAVLCVCPCLDRHPAGRASPCSQLFPTENTGGPWEPLLSHGAEARHQGGDGTRNPLTSPCLSALRPALTAWIRLRGPSIVEQVPRNSIWKLCLVCLVPTYWHPNNT